jgi:hypothetical protein
MKPIKVALLFIAVVLNFGSCYTMKNRNMHDRVLRAELIKYSDVLDIARTEIYFKGMSYYWFERIPPRVYLSLYVKSDHNNRETLITIRDELIDFIKKSWEPTSETYWLPKSVAINFTLGETKNFYSIAYEENYGWYELWHINFFDKPFDKKDNVISFTFDFGKPLVGRTIEELDALLGKYLNSMDVEQFDSYHSGKGGRAGKDYIEIWIFVPNNYNLETVLAIRDDFINFFEDNRQELIEKYGQFNRIYIDFYIMGDVIYRMTARKQREMKLPMVVYELHHKNNEWFERRKHEQLWTTYKPIR